MGVDGFVENRPEDLDERRAKRRFPLRVKARYRILGRHLVAGMCETMNMSSGGIWFIAGRVLPLGSQIELAMRWPPSQGDSRLTATFYGNVIRSSEEGTAMTIQRHDVKLD